MRLHTPLKVRRRDPASKDRAADGTPPPPGPGRDQPPAVGGARWKILVITRHSPSTFRSAK